MLADEGALFPREVACARAVPARLNVDSFSSHSLQSPVCTCVCVFASRKVLLVRSPERARTRSTNKQRWWMPYADAQQMC